jgi:hypothetical protein
MQSDEGLKYYSVSLPSFTCAHINAVELAKIKSIEIETNRIIACDFFKYKIITLVKVLFNNNMSDYCRF